MPVTVDSSLRRDMHILHITTFDFCKRCLNNAWTCQFQLKPERASEVQAYKNWETYDKTLLRPLLVFFLSLQPQRTEREWVKCSSLYYQWSIPQRNWFILLFLNLNMYYKMFVKFATFCSVKLVEIWLICFILVDHVLHWYIHFSAIYWSSWICSS